MTYSLRSSNEERYGAIREHLSSGHRELCVKDYHFYRRYCKKNGIAPLPFVAGSVPSISYVDDSRYNHIMNSLKMGRSIGGTDFAYLKRYCATKNIPMPRLYTKMLYWLEKEAHNDED